MIVSMSSEEHNATAEVGIAQPRIGIDSAWLHGPQIDVEDCHLAAKHPVSKPNEGSIGGYRQTFFLTQDLYDVLKRFDHVDIVIEKDDFRTPFVVLEVLDVLD